MDAERPEIVNRPDSVDPDSVDRPLPEAGASC
jgi:hypothetical protein